MSVNGFRKPFQIVAAYDSETNNISQFGMEVQAYPITHQFGFITDIQIKDIDNNNVENVVDIEIVRHADKAFAIFEDLLTSCDCLGFVPVVMVHNLGFDMWALGAWLNRHDIKVLAKSTTKPITLTVLDDNGKPALVLWDTLGFFGKGLAVMGSECGYPKLSGTWDYDLQRTPETILTDKELAYAEHDIYVMFAYMGYYLRNNPLIDEDSLGQSVMTKTGAVRQKRKRLFDGKRGYGTSQNVGRFWNYNNRINKPLTDDALFTMQACTRGGFTFCASKYAAVPFNLDGSDYVIAGYDANSQHPAQMVSHYYPEKFSEAIPETLAIDVEIIKGISLQDILENWAKPFPIAFNALFRFNNLRMKENTVFSDNGISSLAWARTKKVPFSHEENQSEFKNEMQNRGYQDTAYNDIHAFGKLFSAEQCELWLTELGFWEVCQIFEWDSVEPVKGYSSMKFARPTDMSMLSVMYFYKQKDTFKHFKDAYENREKIEDEKLLRDTVPKSLADSMINGTVLDADVKNYYQLVKADLNALFGIEATNEAKQDMFLTENGIEISEVKGIKNLPKNPKAWYQYGQRIVGWSRIAQIVAMMLSRDHVEGVINGDTDSLKMIVHKDNLSALDSSLEILGQSIDKAKLDVTKRIRRQYKESYVELDKVGYYEREFEVTRFFAAWNKAYCIQKYDKKIKKMKFDFVVAGINTESRFIDSDDSVFENSYNDLADWLFENGWEFERICSLMIGYNVTIDSSIIKNNGRKAPKWGDYFSSKVTDYLGVESIVEEPKAMALFPASKTIGNIENDDNAINMKIALENNPDINVKSVILEWQPYAVPSIIYLED